MNENKEVIKKFYTAFQNKDYETMQHMYADNAVFSDEVFVDLNAKQVRAMWEMLIKRGTDMKLEFKNVHVVDDVGSAEWMATYTFSSTGRKVINRIKANFIFENGKIISHTDAFSFPLWAKQALGFKGLLLGRTNFLRNKVQATAMKNLEDFMKK
ncbi:MAG TPA: nuclear transport factor 2 family protein [Bacteroidia bacterium]